MRRIILSDTIQVGQKYRRLRFEHAVKVMNAKVAMEWSRAGVFGPHDAAMALRGEREATVYRVAVPFSHSKRIQDAVDIAISRDLNVVFDDCDRWA